MNGTSGRSHDSQGPVPESEAASGTPSASDPIDTPAACGEAGDQVVEDRAQRLARIKAEIEAGVYETPDKIASAVAKMLDDLR